jgi:hypothetical protein
MLMAYRTLSLHSACALPSKSDLSTPLYRHTKSYPTAQTVDKPNSRTSDDAGLIREQRVARCESSQISARLSYLINRLSFSVGQKTYIRNDDNINNIGGSATRGYMSRPVFLWMLSCGSSQLRSRGLASVKRRRIVNSCVLRSVGSWTLLPASLFTRQYKLKTHFT